MSNSKERITIRENGLSNSREGITNPWERIAQFDITIYLRFFLFGFFFENPHVPSGLSYTWNNICEPIIFYICNNYENKFRPSLCYSTFTIVKSRNSRPQTGGILWLILKIEWWNPRMIPCGLLRMVYQGEKHPTERTRFKLFRLFSLIQNLRA